MGENRINTTSRLRLTLCRACGVSCRQVAGWLYGASGHVWAEILIGRNNWQQVEPTGAGKLECGSISRCRRSRLLRPNAGLPDSASRARRVLRTRGGGGVAREEPRSRERVEDDRMPGTHKMPRTHKILLSLAAAVLGLR
ncbi:MAG: transglutaminase domain-containing protein [Phycisphaerae bacterium]|nr:transglutaminase domain-containing protein [Phycisphaerae bacterium]